jgi:hypothetical protein
VFVCLGCGHRLSLLLLGLGVEEGGVSFIDEHDDGQDHVEENEEDNDDVGPEIDRGARGSNRCHYRG